MNAIWKTWAEKRPSGNAGSLCSRRRHWRFRAARARLLIRSRLIRMMTTKTLAVLLLCTWPANGQENEPGKKLFVTRCASCHGADGGGGEFGPNIADVRGLAHRDLNVADIVKNGLADFGMPAFPLPQGEVDAIAAYVKGLRVPAIEHPPAGDVEAGKSFFFG